ncbi:hypothetical protein RRV45_12175 [Bacillus sp. DTU_2020_1000418_1_SI_GHA_SEK_038]|uniref:hypothetical protein n=1 Tax=Bacillus sp. DTU_2020_1000418_1_SI_GHA_SEK_038 TaxID=3077585 RepID=UPI0028EDBD35|nr:hypothetical protein [Bacillus sp. DTU_2020_1000418_1_SI_GHA_SEK_038]WNS73675.1 hypothetical protein RRV45_12175 [Bacillus sp. DTU_2020_1000418_1_SI_GHA_SEK_038]
MSNYLCKERLVKGIEVTTPILIPSFSSKGIRQFAEIFYNLKDYLSDATLFSSYDLYYNLIDGKQIYETEILFIDSGGYEAGIEPDLSEIYDFPHKPLDWNEEIYFKQIACIEPMTDIVLINYDYMGLPVFEQINKANSIFSKFPLFSSDFLIKPENGEGKINIESVINNVSRLSSFSILGFTEKELGYSVYERCRNICKIRNTLNDKGLKQPIHIFGCLDPLNIIVYFLCGADIFDGLSWLRYGFKDNNPVYFNSFAISSGNWSLRTDELKLISYLENIKTLNNLKHKMKLFTQENDLSVFELDKTTEREITKIIDLV